MEGDQISKAGLALHETMMAASDHLIVPYVTCEVCQDNLLHNLPWYQHQTDRSAIPLILLFAPIVDWSLIH